MNFAGKVTAYLSFKATISLVIAQESITSIREEEYDKAFPFTRSRNQFGWESQKHMSRCKE